VSPSADERLAAARAALADLSPADEALIVGATRAAADEFAAALAVARGGLFGVGRAGFVEFAARLALPALARDGLAPSTALGEAALAARVAFESHEQRALAYFDPVAKLPGFPLALGSTLSELRQAGVRAEDVDGSASRRDLALLLERTLRARVEAGAADRAEMLAAARAALDAQTARWTSTRVVLLDVAVATAAEEDFLGAILRRAARVFATVHAADLRTRRAFERLGAQVMTASPPPTGAALPRLQHYLFSPDPPPRGTADATVTVFSAPGESREAIEIARRIVTEAERGVRFDEMAVLLRAPQTYLGVLEHALTRAGVPAWYHRGTRRPDPAGRALLALLACADEELSARRFAEYVSLGQVPMQDDMPPEEAYAPPVDDVTSSLVPMSERVDDRQPEDDAALGAARGATDQVIAGTVRAPWRWEDLIVEAAVIGGIDRWQRRLAGLRREYARRLREIASDDPESTRARALRRDAEQLDALSAFALPVLQALATWPAAQRWADWLRSLIALAPRVLRDPARVLRVLQELAPLASVGPVRLREVRDVLTPRLATLTAEPPRRRHGRVFVGTPQAARGRAFRVVFVPGLAERVFPQRIREDALLLDEHRAEVSPSLRRKDDRVADERLHLGLAVGAASERIYLSYPRMELNESRPRVPSFYVLDVVRAIEGDIPDAATLAGRAFRAGESTLAWPAPARAEAAIDDFEHDLATLGRLLRSDDPIAARGRARYLYELSPELQRSLTSRWLRWHRRAWDPADGLTRAVPSTAPMLTTQRLGARAYSLSALQRFAACPYQFLLAAIYRLAPLDPPAPLQRIDPLTRGDLFHRVQALALSRFRDEGLLPVAKDKVATAQKLLEWAVTEVEREAFDELAPAIERVWRDEIAEMTRDLKIWIEHLADEGQEWTPEYFEFAFGLDDRKGRDPHSVREPVMVDGRFKLRGSIDLIERHRKTGFLRVTDHKTGKNRTKPGTTVVQGGRVLQPVIYALAVEALWPGQTVFSGRLWFCTTAGGFTPYEIPLLDNARRQGLEVLEIVDRAIEHGILAASPAKDACRYCDFGPVCGREEERRIARKTRDLMADLDALRGLP
jgi:hypothetical protein